MTEKNGSGVIVWIWLLLCSATFRARHVSPNAWAEGNCTSTTSVSGCWRFISRFSPEVEAPARSDVTPRLSTLFQNKMRCFSSLDHRLADTVALNLDHGHPPPRRGISNERHHAARSARPSVHTERYRPGIPVVLGR